MGYAIMRIEKIKSIAEMNSRYEHNFRLRNSRNVSSELSHLNYDLQGEKRTPYSDLYEREIEERIISGSITEKIRKDAVLGLEVVMTFSHEDIGRFDVNEWAEDSRNWLERTFNPPDREITYIHDENEIREKVQNVKSCVLHLDEGTPHLHAFIVPINSEGKLSAFYYSDGPSKMRELQDSYALAMEKYNFRPGVKDSKLVHEPAREFFKKLERPIEDVIPRNIKEVSRDTLLDTVHDLQQLCNYYRARCQQLERELDSIHRDIKGNGELTRS